MNFAQMLLGDYKVPTPPKPKAVVPKNAVANEVKRRNAINKYRAVMPTGEWVSTHMVENRMGMGRSCAVKMLSKWHKDGLLERRPNSAFDSEQFSPRHGYEWRWMK